MGASEPTTTGNVCPNPIPDPKDPGRRIPNGNSGLTFEKAVQKILDGGKTLTVTTWNEFQRFRGLLESHGGRYSSLPKGDGRILHQVNIPQGIDMLSVQYIAQAS